MNRGKDRGPQRAGQMGMIISRFSTGSLLANISNVAPFFYQCLSNPRLTPNDAIR